MPPRPDDEPAPIGDPKPPEVTPAPGNPIDPPQPGKPPIVPPRRRGPPIVPPGPDDPPIGPPDPDGPSQALPRDTRCEMP